LDELLKFILKYVPKIVDVGIKLIIALLRGIADKIDDVTLEAVKVIMAFVRGLSESVVYIVDEAFKIIIAFINGLADAISGNSGELTAACKKLVMAIVDAIGSFHGMIVDTGKDIIAGLAKGLWDNAKSLVSTICDVISNAWDSVLDFFGIKSPAKKGIEAGMYVDKGLALGFERYSKLVSSSAVGVGSKAMSSLQKSLSDVSDVINTDIDSQPTIRPVLDLSNITAGANSINGMFSDGKTLTVNPQYAGLASVAMSGYNNSRGSDDVVSAVNKLGKKIDGIRNTTYQINVITYDDGSNVSDAVATLVRAVKIERRV
jgi:phage-related protein